MAANAIKGCGRWTAVKCCPKGCQLAKEPDRSDQHCQLYGCFVAEAAAMVDDMRAGKVQREPQEDGPQVDIFGEARTRTYERRLVCSRCGLPWESGHRPDCEQITAVPGQLFISDPAGSRAAIRRWGLSKNANGAGP